jgi:hypothetical protein
MISGAMPKRKRVMHASVAAFIFLVFAGAALVNAQYLLLTNQPVEPTLKTTALLFILLAIGVVAMQAWFLRRIIREFTYDGTTLQFRTLARAEPQTRVASQVLGIRDWAGRGGLNGYKLIFRDAPRAYLESDTPNAALLIEHLLRDMPRDR